MLAPDARAAFRTGKAISSGEGPWAQVSPVALLVGGCEGWAGERREIRIRPRPFWVMGLPAREAMMGECVMVYVVRLYAFE